MKTIAKIQQDKWLGGVCSGFAYAIGAPTWIIRLSAVALTMTTCLPGLFYLLFWVFMPRWKHDPQDYLARTQQIVEDGVTQGNLHQ